VLRCATATLTLMCPNGRYLVGHRSTLPGGAQVAGTAERGGGCATASCRCLVGIQFWHQYARVRARVMGFTPAELFPVPALSYGYPRTPGLRPPFSGYFPRRRST
jgi:hypothetical protein